MEQTVVSFLPGPVGLQLEEDPQYGCCRVVRFVDGGPRDPGPSRACGKIQPGDWIIRVKVVHQHVGTNQEEETETETETTYSGIMRLLQQASHLTRELTVRSFASSVLLSLTSDESSTACSDSANNELMSENENENENESSGRIGASDIVITSSEATASEEIDTRLTGDEILEDDRSKDEILSDDAQVTLERDQLEMTQVASPFPTSVADIEMEKIREDDTTADLVLSKPEEPTSETPNLPLHLLIRSATTSSIPNNPLLLIAPKRKRVFPTKKKNYVANPIFGTQLALKYSQKLEPLLILHPLSSEELQKKDFPEVAPILSVSFPGRISLPSCSTATATRHPTVNRTRTTVFPPRLLLLLATTQCDSTLEERLFLDIQHAVEPSQIPIQGKDDRASNSSVSPPLSEPCIVSHDLLATSLRSSRPFPVEIVLPSSFVYQRHHRPKIPYPELWNFPLSISSLAEETTTRLDEKQMLLLLLPQQQGGGSETGCLNDFHSRPILIVETTVAAAAEQAAHESKQGKRSEGNSSFPIEATTAVDNDENEGSLLSPLKQSSTTPVDSLSQDDAEDAADQVDTEMHPRDSVSPSSMTGSSDQKESSLETSIPSLERTHQSSTSSDFLQKAKAKHQLSLARLRIKKQNQKSDLNKTLPETTITSSSDGLGQDETIDDESMNTPTTTAATAPTDSRQTTITSSEELGQESIDDESMNTPSTSAATAPTDSQQTTITSSEELGQESIDDESMNTPSTSAATAPTDSQQTTITSSDELGQETIDESMNTPSTSAATYITTDPQQQSHTTESSPALLPAAAPSIDFSQFSQEKSIVFKPGPVGMQLEPTLPNPQHHHPLEYPATIVRFVDGGPYDPGAARSSGKLCPGDFVVRVEAEGVVGTTYYTILHLLQKSWTTRKLTFRSAWDPGSNIVTTAAPTNSPDDPPQNEIPPEASAKVTPSSSPLLSRTFHSTQNEKPKPKQPSQPHRPPRQSALKDTAPHPYDWTPLPFDWINKGQPPRPQSLEERKALEEAYRIEAARLVHEQEERRQRRRRQLAEEEEEHRRLRQTTTRSSWNFEDLMLGAVAVTAESVIGCLRKKQQRRRNGDDDDASEDDDDEEYEGQNDHQKKE
jgi:hypothetical protein